MYSDDNSGICYYERLRCLNQTFEIDEWWQIANKKKLKITRTREQEEDEDKTK